MLALVTNFGPTRSFATAVGNVFVPHGMTVEMTHEKACREIEAYGQVRVEYRKKPRRKARKPTTEEYMSMAVNRLRLLARQAGVRGTFAMKKVDLIKHLEA
jgi:preprotein translocase subunit Sss1